MFWRSSTTTCCAQSWQAKRGTKVIFIPGNHDEVFREFDGAVFGNMKFTAIHPRGGTGPAPYAGDARRRIDSVVKCSPGSPNLGSKHLRPVAGCEPLYQLVRRKLDLPQWSLYDVLEAQAEDSSSASAAFEEAVTMRARKAPRRGLRGVRPHPPCEMRENRRHSLLHRWRLGGELALAGGGHNGQCGSIDCQAARAIAGATGWQCPSARWPEYDRPWNALLANHCSVKLHSHHPPPPPVPQVSADFFGRRAATRVGLARARAATPRCDDAGLKPSTRSSATRARKSAIL